MNLLLWPTREKFVNTVFNYILVSASTAQVLIIFTLAFLLLLIIATDAEVMCTYRSSFVCGMQNRWEVYSRFALQELTEKLLSYMHDLEYRVRRLLSMRAKVFFQTWDGHHGLFRDVW